MRTFTIEKKLRSVLKWLRIWMISQKKVLSTREAALYLKTDVGTIYRLTQRYYLPSHKTKKQLLYFKRKEIDTWLQPRRRRDLPQALREKKETSLEMGKWKLEIGKWKLGIEYWLFIKFLISNF